MPDTNYYLKPGEGIDAYNKRIAAYNASKNATPTSTQPAIKDLYGSVSQSDRDLEALMNDARTTALTPVDQEAVRTSTMRALQAEIDATNNLFAQKLAEAKQQGLGRVGSTNAIQARRGLIGSDFGASQQQDVQNYNNQIEGGIRNEQALAISAIMGRGNKMAQEEIAAKNAARQQGAEAYLKYLSESDNRRTMRTSEAAQRALAAGYDLSTADEASIKAIADSYQISPNSLRSAFSELQAAQEAAAMEAEKQRLGLEKTRFEVDNQGRILNADLGLKELDALYKKAQIAKTDAERNKIYQEISNIKSNMNGSDQLYSGLSNATATAVRSKVGKYSTEPLVQNFATIQEGYNFAKSINTKTTNPADDQALIYSLAKTLDPGSVVREGEYATAQKYAQSWVSAYGKGVTQALAGTGFLSETARSNIKKTIESKYQASKKSYDNTNKQYVTNINSLTGRTDGAAFLVDYATPQDTTTQEQSTSLGDDEAYQLYLQAVSK